MVERIMYYYDKFTSLTFWQEVTFSYLSFGPLAPILFAYLESLVPALPLVAIIAFNTATHGYFLGMLYSAIGTITGSVSVFLLIRYLRNFWLIQKLVNRPKIAKGLDKVSNINFIALLIISAVPFTPSSLINISFGLSDYDKRSFCTAITIGKAIMVFIFATFGTLIKASFEEPLFLILAGVILLITYILSKMISKKYKIDKL